MVKASPTAAFVVTETEFLLEFEIISLDPPAKFGLIDRAFERDVGGPCGKPVVIRFGFTLRPLDQQPLFSRRLAPPGVVVGRATRHRVNREVGGVLLPSRQVIVCLLG